MRKYCLCVCWKLLSLEGAVKISGDGSAPDAGALGKGQQFPDMGISVSAAQTPTGMQDRHRQGLHSRPMLIPEAHPMRGYPKNLRLQPH